MDKSCKFKTEAFLENNKILWNSETNTDNLIQIPTANHITLIKKKFLQDIRCTFSSEAKKEKTKKTKKTTKTSIR